MRYRQRFPIASGSARALLLLALATTASAGCGIEDWFKPCPEGTVARDGQCVEVPPPPPQCEQGVFDPDLGRCICRRNSDCGPRNGCSSWMCVRGGTCVAICNVDACCRNGEVCEDFMCRTVQCVVDEDCGEGGACIGEKCVSPPTAAQVASCFVQPAQALLRAGVAREFSVVARDAAGNVLPYKGEVAWSGAASFIGADTRVKVMADASGPLLISAGIGDVSCEPALALSYGEVEGGLRVVVADALTGAPVPGALVVSGEDRTVSNGEGVAQLGEGAEKRTVSVFHAGYAFVTLIGVTGDDLVVPLRPRPVKVGFAGTKREEDFAYLQALNETVHVMLAGASIPGSLIDLDLGTLVGDLVDTELDLGSTKETVGLPSGAVLGLGKQMFKSDYAVLAPPGVRTLWALGGNASFADISGAIAPALADSTNVNVGGIISAILPIIGRLQSGALTALATPEPGEGGAPVYLPIDLPLNTLLRLNLQARLPRLWDETTPEAGRFDGAFVLGGVMHSPQGLVPLGITAGIDEDGDNQVKDGRVNNPFDRDRDGTLPLRFAPRHSGLETSPFVSIALATSLSGLFGGGDESPRPPRVLSGLVKFPQRFAYEKDPRKAPALDFGLRWLAAPSAITQEGRAITVTKVPGASFHRLDIGDAKTGEWLVYFAPAGGETTTVELPAIPEDLGADPFATARTLRLQSVALAADAGVTFETLTRFDAVNLDDFNAVMEAFSVREVER